MALKGTLRDFSVADIFQLIGQQQKSGSLYVSSKEKEAHIVFDKGRVILSTFRKSEEDLLLGTLMLNAQIIDEKTLNTAVEKQKSTRKSLGDILISLEAITPEILSEFVLLQTKEVLFRLFQWKDGLYEFVSEEIRYNPDIIKSQSAEAILMDCFRMLDEWPGVKRKIVSRQSVFRSLVDITELTESPTKKEEPSSKDKTKELSPDEKKVLKLLDGQRTIQDVIHLCRLGTFDTCRTITQLMDRGSIIKVTQLSNSRRETVIIAHPETLKTWLTSSYQPLLVLFAVATLLPLLAVGVKSHWSHRFGLYQNQLGRAYSAEISFQTIQKQNELKRIEALLELWRIEKGRYPGTIKEINPSLAPDWDYKSTEGHRGYLLKQKTL